MQMGTIIKARSTGTPTPHAIPIIIPRLEDDESPESTVEFYPLLFSDVVEFVELVDV